MIQIAEKLEFVHGNPEVPDDILDRWQGIADTAAKIIGVPSGLIMRVHENEIEVFVSSRTEGTPYEVGAREHLNSGLYCETVMSDRRLLHVPNALKDPEWESNPDVPLGMISYLGLPLRWPDDETFGTICVLDNKEHHFNELHIELLERLRDAVEADLRRRVLGAVLTIGPPSLRRTGEVVGRATEGIDAVGGLAATFLPQLISGMSIPILLGIVVTIAMCGDAPPVGAP